MTEHDSHERYHLEECAACDAEFERQKAYHGALYRAEAPYRESVALAREAIGSDRAGDLDADEMAAIQRTLK
jgi:hypothetical protein